ncbi:MAG: hypothetical protein ACYSU7_15625 [Planctomycetota bacterium]
MADDVENADSGADASASEQPVAPTMIADPELARLVEAWPKLDEPIRAAIMALVGVRS